MSIRVVSIADVSRIMDGILELTRWDDQEGEPDYLKSKEKLYF